MERSSGILMHISSLPNRFGIGSIGRCAYDFVDFLAQAKQRYWQILPLGHSATNGTDTISIDIYNKTGFGTIAKACFYELFIHS